MKTPSLSIFYTELGQHDWFYMMSDDPKVYSRGSDRQSYLERMAKTSPEHQKLFDEWKAYAVTHTGPRPEKPHADG